jgi:uncharacterized RDD family membrane protein YckC
MEAIIQADGEELAGHAESEVELAKAWPRFWARLVDISILAYPVGMLLGLLFPSLMALELNTRAGEIVIGIMALPVIMVIDALLISLLGTSPGKAIVGLKVVDMQMRKLSTETALRRNLLVYFKGLFGGIPVLNLVGYVMGHNDVRDHGFTSWDEATDSRVIENGYNVARAAIAAAIVIGLNAAARFL